MHSPRSLRRLAVASGLVLLLAGCAKPAATDSSGVSTADLSSPAPSPVNPATPLTPPTRHTPAGPIPVSAFFVPPSTTSGGQTFPAPTKDLGSLWPLCGARFSSDEQVADRQGRQVVHYPPGAGADSIPDATVDHTITLYRPGAGTVALQEINAAVQACPHDTRDGSKLDYQLLPPKAHGDGALLIQETWNPQPGTAFVPVTSLTSVVRVGDVVTVLRFIGWEGADADPAATEDYTSLAVTAISTWIG